MKATRPRIGRNGDDRILLGLYVSELSLAPGETRTVADLAAFCGCTHQNISQIEKRALKKLRRKLAEWKEAA